MGRNKIKLFAGVELSFFPFMNVSTEGELQSIQIGVHLIPQQTLWFSRKNSVNQYTINSQPRNESRPSFRVCSAHAAPRTARVTVSRCVAHAQRQRCATWRREHCPVSLSAMRNYPTIASLSGQFFTLLLAGNDVRRAPGGCGVPLVYNCVLIGTQWKYPTTKLCPANALVLFKDIN